MLLGTILELCLKGQSKVKFEAQAFILPFRISKGRGAIAGIEYGESNLEARPGAILSHTC